MNRFMKCTSRSIIFLLAITGACEADERQFGAVEFSDSSPLQEFLIDPFEQPIGHSMVLQDVKEKILQRFGEPQKTDVAFEIDRHGGEGAEIRLSTLSYPGLIFRIGDRPGSNAAWLNEIEITGEQYRLKYELGIGVSHQDFIDALQPDSYIDTKSLLQMSDDIWEIRYGDSTEDDFRVGASIKLELKFDVSDRVSKVMWIRQAGH